MSATVKVPTEIDRSLHANVLSVWNDGLANCETLEMLWPKLVKAMLAAAPQESDEVAALRKRVAELERDAERLDFIDGMQKGYAHGYGWILQDALGRGPRLHQTFSAFGKPTVRDAIDAAIAAQGNESGHE